MIKERSYDQYALQGEMKIKEKSNDLYLKIGLKLLSAFFSFIISLLYRATTPYQRAAATPIHQNPKLCPVFFELFL